MRIPKQLERLGIGVIMNEMHSAMTKRIEQFVGYTKWEHALIS